MAFKKPPVRVPAPESPDRLFMDLPLRSHTSLLDHQGQVLRSYHAQGCGAEDVALQLPTGSGKTLVGLLLAEWRRRKFQEKVVYLCPTRQLVNQVTEEASVKCGLRVEPFIGTKERYTAQVKSAYNNANCIAITTYNSLFNINLFFSNPDIIILDDAHTSENYIANQWTLKFTSHVDGLLFKKIANTLKSIIDENSYKKLIEESDSSMQWVDKIPTPHLIKISSEIRTIIDENIDQDDKKYPWQMIKNNLHACHIYISSGEILIRPLIPPTWTHEPFANAKQRIFMSATLSFGSNLERLTGRKTIPRLPIPKGWNKQGIGRRLFIFPENSLEENDIKVLRSKLIEEAGRCLILAPSNYVANQIRDDIENSLPQCIIFSGVDLESRKEEFVNTDSAVAVIANRYDGIDFPNDDCRLLFIDNLQKAVNLQEFFLMTRMAAKLLFNERIQTRVLQAIGRCSRGPKDYSAVIITGHLNYLSDQKRIKHFHPELQAELMFGIEQSQKIGVNDLIDNFRIFLEHKNEWAEANDQILEKREEVTQQQFPAMHELAKTVNHEINWQKAMWEKDYVKAFDDARDVLGELRDSELKGYRALWHYLAGSSAKLEAIDSDGSWESKAREQFIKAKNATFGISWLSRLANSPNVRYRVEEEIQNIASVQIENLEQYLEELGNIENRKFCRREREISEGLRPNTGKLFEQANMLLGKHLGFEAELCSKRTAAPDVLWLIGSTAIVFEDHANAGEESIIDIKKARQTALHSNWARDKFPNMVDLKVLVVLVTPAKKANKDAIKFLKNVCYWKLDEFLAWSETALCAARELRREFPGIGNLDWRTSASIKLKNIKADVYELSSWLSQQVASEYLGNTGKPESGSK